MPARGPATGDGRPNPGLRRLIPAVLKESAARPHALITVSYTHLDVYKRQQRTGIVLLVVREMTIIAAIAVAVALPAVVALARLFKSQLYGVTTFDPLSLAAAALLTGLAVSLAATMPARRAASIEPMQALRTE